MTEQSSTVAAIAIALGLLTVEGLSAQENRVAPEALPQRGIEQNGRSQRDAAIAEKKMLQRAMQEQPELRRDATIAEQNGPAARAARDARMATQEALLRTAALQRLQDAIEKQALRREQELRAIDSLLSHFAAQAEAHPAREGRQSSLRAAIEPYLYTMAFGAVDPGSAHATFTRYIDTRLNADRRTLSLTLAHESKLRLAAEGDIKRYFDQVDGVTARFVAAVDEPDIRSELIGELSRLRRIKVSVPFGEGSLYSKVLERIRREQDRGEPGAGGRPAP